MGSLSISEESLTIPMSLFLHEVSVDDSLVVGSGCYGTVLKAKWYGTDVAVKKLHDIFFKSQNTSELRSGVLRQLARELNILVKLNHPNIVQFYGIYKPPGAKLSLELSPDTYIVQELMVCSLDVRNLQRPRLSFQNVVDICLSISSGLRYLHDRQEPIIHRDLATKNILLNYKGVAKIGDLGVAKVLNQNLSSILTRQPGTELYMPPEVKIQGVAYDTKIDIYSFGVVMLEVSLGRGATAREAFEVAQFGSGMIKLVPELERRDKDFNELGERHPLRELILECLGKRDTRPSAKTIACHLLELTKSKDYCESIVVPVIAPTTSERTPFSPTISSDTKELSEKVVALEKRKESLENELDKVSGELERKESELLQLMNENARLQVTLSQKESEMERLSKVSSPPSSLTDTEMRDQRGLLLQRLNRLEMRDLESQEKIVALTKESEVLRRELEQARAHGGARNNYPLTGKTFASSGSSHGSSSSQLTSTTGSSSLSSLETLMPSISALQTSSSTLTSTSSGSSEPMTSLSTLTTSSSSLSQSTGTQKSNVPTVAEFKKLKKQLDRYKSVNVELDMRLKDAKLELQKHDGQQVNSDIMYQMDVQRLSAENTRLQLQLDSAVNENGRLRSDLISRRY